VLAHGAAHPRLVLATTILASSLSFIDGSIVNVGLPAIGRGLHAAGGNLSWIINGYLLPLSALLLIGGAAGDLYGRRKLLIILDALGGCFKLKSVGQPKDGTHDSFALIVLAKTIDKAAIDLDPVQLEGKELAQRRIAGAEVVNRNAYARLAQLPSDL